MCWYRAEKNKSLRAQAQVEGNDFDYQDEVENFRYSRYQGIITYRVDVPASAEKTEEVAAANQAAEKLYNRIWNSVGDQVVSYEEPEFIQSYMAR